VSCFFYSISDRRNVLLWGVSSGILVTASLFGLIDEGLVEGTPQEIVAGMVLGVVLIFPLTFL
jgi:ZIP family zinc transporter